MKKIICTIISAAMLFMLAPSAHAVSISGISAKASIIIEAQSGKVIAGKNEYEKLPMASTTKIMTTLLLIESGGLDEEFRVDNNAIMVEGSSMGLCQDDIVTKRALCYGMMLPSGNDAANETAVLLGGSAEKFADMMNEKADQLGLEDTHFVTPSGLHDDKHYSTAYDMAKLTREALKNETFREICGTSSIKLKFGNPPYERWLVNTNKLLALYDGCIGVKTGFTDEAGRCLISAAEKDGVTLICVTLNAPNDWNDHIRMYDYGFSVTESRSADFDFSGLYVDVAGGDTDRVKVAPADVPQYTIVNGEVPKMSYKVNLDKFIYAPVSKGRKAGTIEFYSGDDLIMTSELAAENGCGVVINEYKPKWYEIIVEWFKRLIA
ncbi:MAG: D-alanyl-D-alanine carboxypeptidase [Oscillospiraceae bacterium]|nr:D-alanyl-D-alanine carboxypeptidase [Oscillospiraceae bacterium]